MREKFESKKGGKKLAGKKIRKAGGGPYNKKPFRKSEGVRPFSLKRKSDIEDSDDKPFRKIHGSADSPSEKTKNRVPNGSGYLKREEFKTPFKKSFSKSESGSSAKKDFSPRFKKPFRKPEGDTAFSLKRSEKKDGSEKKSFRAPFSKSESGSVGKKDSASRFKKPFQKSGGDAKPQFKRGRDTGDSGNKPFRKSYGDADNSFKNRNREDKERSFKSTNNTEGNASSPLKRTGEKAASTFVKKTPFRRKDSDAKSYFKGDRVTDTGEEGFKKSFARNSDKESAEEKRVPSPHYTKKPFQKTPSKYSKGEKINHTSKKEDDGLMRLNKYIANAGICSRREADVLIQTGSVSVNGTMITELGYRIKPTDMVSYGGQTIKREKLVYIVINKPKNFITTSDDPYDRETVLSLIKDACKERVYPVGRLDRNTTGVLIITNDGEMTKKLTHPRYEKKKIYHVVLDKTVTGVDIKQIKEGLELEDGLIQVDEVSYVSGADKKEVGIELHSGKNRIVRRIFEHLGYDVKKLDRVSFAGLTKKDLPRGRWRFLTQQEIDFLKMS